eukprot:g59673.t1
MPKRDCFSTSRTRVGYSKSACPWVDCIVDVPTAISNDRRILFHATSQKLQELVSIFTPDASNEDNWRLNR